LDIIRHACSVSFRLWREVRDASFLKSAQERFYLGLGTNSTKNAGKSILNCGGCSIKLQFRVIVRDRGGALRRMAAKLKAVTIALLLTLKTGSLVMLIP
jgi:hypothetical protein